MENEMNVTGIIEEGAEVTTSRPVNGWEVFGKGCAAVIGASVIVKGVKKLVGWLKSKGQKVDSQNPNGETTVTDVVTDENTK